MGWRDKQPHGSSYHKALYPLGQNSDKQWKKGYDVVKEKNIDCLSECTNTYGWKNETKEIQIPYTKQC